MKTSNEIDKIFPVFLKLQISVKDPKKNATNVLTKQGHTSRYATLDAFMDAVKPIANELGIIICQEGDTVDNLIRITTIFIHADSGQYVSFSGFPVPSVGLTAQQVAAATTYLRRYSLSSALGLIADEDDDGKTASEQKPVQKAATVPQKKIESQIGVIDENYVHTKGKYAGKTLKEISEIDLAYCEWLSEKWGDEEIRDICKELVRKRIELNDSVPF